MITIIIVTCCYCDFSSLVSSSVFPCGDEMVAIIDDREDIWGRCPNLVHVKPYVFFAGTADINAPPSHRDMQKPQAHLSDPCPVKHRPGQSTAQDVQTVSRGNREDDVAPSNNSNHNNNNNNNNNSEQKDANVQQGKEKVALVAQAVAVVVVMGLLVTVVAPVVVVVVVVVVETRVREKMPYSVVASLVNNKLWRKKAK